MNILTRALVIALLVTPAVVSADTPAKDTTTKAEKPAKLTATELQVAAHYHALNQMEIGLGKAAGKKSDSKDVKAYGSMLVKDHGESDKKLVTFVKKSGQTIPAVKPADDVEKQTRAEDKAAAAKLKTLKGADFDREYLRMMVQGHEKELAMLDAKKAQVTNPELQEMIEGLRPVLQHHADAAKELQRNEPTAAR